jgi:hypothetical protein
MVTGGPTTSDALPAFDSLCIEIFDTVVDHRGTALLGNPLLPRRQLVVLTARFPSACVMQRVAGALRADIEAIHLAPDASRHGDATIRTA